MPGGGGLELEMAQGTLCGHPDPEPPRLLLMEVRGVEGTVSFPPSSSWG